MTTKSIQDAVNDFIATLDTLSYTKETPRGWVVCGTRNGEFVIKEIKDYL